MENYDFSGWVTKYNVKCSDGRTILPKSFAHNSGKVVPLVWNHNHDDPEKVLGKVLLKNMDEGVYGYGSFNDSETAKTAKLLIAHGDIDSMSICAGKLREQLSTVSHGDIKEVSLVLAGANEAAHIDNVIKHGEELDDEAWIHIGSDITIEHADEEGELNDEENEEEEDMANTEEKTIQDVLDTMNEEQKNAMMYVVSELLDDDDDDDDYDDDEYDYDDDEEGDDDMKHNAFDIEDNEMEGVLTHSDQMEILSLAKSNSVGSLQTAIERYVEDSPTLKHGIDEIESLFPDYKDVYGGAPEKIKRDLGWVGKVMNGVKKSPISRIRTRHADARGADLRANGYKKGKYKEENGKISLLKRTTDPQTIYVKDSLKRDDIVDITDFNVVEYVYDDMKDDLLEEVATAIMIGDGRDDGDDMKISEEHIRPIWTDDDLYTIHHDIDLAGQLSKLQGSDTDKYFGDNFVYAEAVIEAALYAREKYKGSGNVSYYCDPHSVNVMLLARDRNGRRVYNTVTDLQAALNVKEIVTCEQFANKTRVNSKGETKKLIGIFVNLSDYQVGSTKGGEITRFSQFDIDFNNEKYLLETRCSGALTKVYSAIALEEPVTE